MASRFLLTSLGLFWAAMTVLLWRAEYTDSQMAGVPVDPAMVWERILTSLDSSSMAIIHHNRRLGFAHLIASVTDTHNAAPTNAPEGMIRDIGHYRLDLSGSLDDPGDGSRLRFDGEMRLTPDHRWEAIQVQIIKRPLVVSLVSTRSEGLIRLRVENGDFSMARVVRFADLEQPQVLLAQLVDPETPLAMDLVPFTVPSPTGPVSRQDLEWTAMTDRMMIGNSPSQVYRLELKPLQGYAVAILVSRAGEILKVELPQDVTLINEALTGL